MYFVRCSFDELWVLSLLAHTLDHFRYRFGFCTVVSNFVMIPLLAGVLQLFLYFVLNMGMPYAHGLIPDSIEHFCLQFGKICFLVLF